MVDKDSATMVKDYTWVLAQIDDLTARVAQIELFLEELIKKMEEYLKCQKF